MTRLSCSRLERSLVAALARCPPLTPVVVRITAQDTSPSRGRGERVVGAARRPEQLAARGAAGRRAPWRGRRGVADARAVGQHQRLALLAQPDGKYRYELPAGKGALAAAEAVAYGADAVLKIDPADRRPSVACSRSSRRCRGRAAPTSPMSGSSTTGRRCAGK